MRGLDVGSAASIAIRLRLLVRAAIDRGDDREMCRLNRLADAAYHDLAPQEARIYLDWCRDDMQPFLWVGGDA